MTRVVVPCIVQVLILVLLVTPLPALLLASSPAFAASTDTIRFGDRLRVTFYETLEIPAPGSTGKANEAGAALVQTFYQRVDLSNEYAVESDGTIVVPLLGPVPALGQSTEALRSALTTIFESTLGRRGGVTVGLVQRAPVYIVGPVRTPGPHSYSSGMIVLQALALAGGTERSVAGAAKVIELMREREQQLATRGRLIRALARRAALQAGHGSPAAAAAVERLRSLTSEKEAQAILAVDVKLARIEADLSAREDGTRRSAAGAATTEVEILRKRLAAFADQLNVRGDRLKTMEALYARQVVESERVADVRRDFIDMEARRREFEAGVIQAESRQEQAKEAAEQGAARAKLAAEKELALLDVQIATDEQALVTSLAVMSTMTGGTMDEKLTFEIVRSGRGGVEVLVARETDPVEPGDVVKVMVGPGRPPAGGAEAPPQRETADDAARRR